MAAKYRDGDAVAWEAFEGSWSKKGNKADNGKAGNQCLKGEEQGGSGPKKTKEEGKVEMCPKVGMGVRISVGDALGQAECGGM